MTVDTNVTTPAVETAPVVKYPAVLKSLERLAKSMHDAATASISERIAQYDAALNGFANMPDLPAIVAARAALEVERESAIADVVDDVLADIHKTYADMFAAIMPAVKPAPVSLNTPRQAAGIQNASAGNSVTLADGSVYVKRTLNRDAYDESGAADACAAIGCSLCEHAAKASKMKNYASYKATLDKLMQTLTSDYVVEHDACLQNVYGAGLDAFPAVTYPCYTPAAR